MSGRPFFLAAFMLSLVHWGHSRHVNPNPAIVSSMNGMPRVRMRLRRAAWLVLCVAAVGWLAFFILATATADGRSPRNFLWSPAPDRVAYVCLHNGVLNVGRIDGWETYSVGADAIEWAVESFSHLSAFDYHKSRLAGGSSLQFDDVSYDLGILAFSRVALFQGPWPTQHVVSVSTSLPWTVLGIWAFLMVRRVTEPIRRWLRRRRRRQRGLCTSCGYDLRGTVSGICSECGQPVTVN
jgi:hypothetical protein